MMNIEPLSIEMDNGLKAYINFLEALRDSGQIFLMQGVPSDYIGEDAKDQHGVVQLKLTS